MTAGLRGTNAVVRLGATLLCLYVSSIGYVRCELTRDTLEGPVSAGTRTESDIATSPAAAGVPVEAVPAASRGDLVEDAVGTPVDHLKDHRELIASLVSPNSADVELTEWSTAWPVGAHEQIVAALRAAHGGRLPLWAASVDLVFLGRKHGFGDCLLQSTEDGTWSEADLPRPLAPFPRLSELAVRWGWPVDFVYGNALQARACWEELGVPVERLTLERRAEAAEARLAELEQAGSTK